MAVILCVDDDRYLTDLLCYALTREGFEVLIAHAGSDALRLLRGTNLDLVILDVNMPDMNGFKVLSSLRTFSQVPVMMLTARGQDEDVIAGFQQGADDYVTKPFSMHVLVNRVKAMLRRETLHPQKAVDETRLHPLQGGALFDTAVNELVGYGDVRVALTPTEGRILDLLLLHEGQVLSAERIMERIWGYDSESDVNVIKTHIRHIRIKLSSLPGHPHVINTLPGLGYVVHNVRDSNAS